MVTSMYSRPSMAATPHRMPKIACAGAVTGREVISVAMNHAASISSPQAMW